MEMISLNAVIAEQHFHVNSQTNIILLVQIFSGMIGNVEETNFDKKDGHYMYLLLE